MLLISRTITGVVNFINLRNSRPQPTTMMLSVTILFTVFSIGTGYEPGKLVFDASVVNITVISNTTAVLPCSVENRRSHKVAWMNPNRILISFGDRMVIDDTRMSIERPYTEDWNLHIRKIRYSDVGSYRCSVDTNPVLVKIFYLDVQVPPTINDWSTEDMVAREGDQVQLICNATGHPMPVITWIKRLSNGHEEHISNPGEVLLIHNVSRYFDGIYECRADNGILPNAVRQIQVKVELSTGMLFDDTPLNVTVTAGETAILPCSVENLGKNNTVIWVNPFDILISIEDRRIIDNTRMSVERPYTKDWNLHIREVRYDDKGLYTCQVNTNPIKIKRVFLGINVPSIINDELSSEDIYIREGESVDVICNATGIPMPNVRWMRTTKYNPQIDEHLESTGEVLSMKNISRYDDGTYTCLAYNGVPPAATRNIKIYVQFPPEIRRLGNRRLGQSLGKETILECMVTAEPQARFEWLHDGVVMPSNTWKYRTEVYRETLDTVTLSLRIRNVDKSDYGFYTCVVTNILGGDEKQMELYGEIKIIC